MGGQASQHWDSVWASKQPEDVSWFETSASNSDLVLSLTPSGGSVIDVGGGASRLVDQLLADGVRDVTVLDIAASALAHARERLGDRAASVDWIMADVTSWTPTRTWDVWHDRAVLHFLHDDNDIDRYLSAAAQGVAHGGHLVISVFGLDGPTQCSGLEVRRWSVEELAERLASVASIVDDRSVTHLTPWQSEQSFITVVARRSEAATSV